MYAAGKSGSSSSTAHSVEDTTVEQCEGEEAQEILSDSTSAHIQTLFDKFEDQQDYKYIDELRNNLRKLGKHETIKNSELGQKQGIEYHLEKSRIQMRELLQMGREFITNVETVARERKYLIEQNINQHATEMQEKIAGEKLESNAKIREIEQKWTELVPDNDDVMQVLHFAKMYKQQIEHVCKQKDAIIALSLKELARINTFYEFLVERQSHEMQCIQNRFESELQLFRNTYKQHIDSLHNILMSERNNITNQFINRFHLHMNKLYSMKEKMLAIDRNKTNVYFKSIEEVTGREHEITVQMNLCLQKLNDKLQLELRKIQVHSFMQSEIIDYNTFVLRTQNDEGYILNNQQNLRITKLNDQIYKLRDIFKVQKRLRKHEIHSLTNRADILHTYLSRYEQQGLCMQQKNVEMFKKMWAFHMAELQPLVRKVFEIDRLLYEQNLQLEWIPPKADFEIFNDYSYPADKFRKNSSTNVNETQKNKPNVQVKRRGRKSEKQQLFENRFLRNILRTLGDRKGGLMPQKFRSLLIGYKKDACRLVEVHYIFNAVQVTEMKDLDLLMEIFEPYAWCPNCSDDLSSEVITRLYEHDEDPEDVLSIIEKRKKNAIPSDKCKNHYYVTDPMFLFAALKDFVVTRAKLSRKEINIQDIEKLPEIVEIKQFWQNIVDFMPEQKRKVWRWLEHGLQHFLITLKEREQLLRECKQLKRQNIELKYLLQNFKSK